MNATQLTTLADEYFHHRMAAGPFMATMLGIEGYDTEVPDPSRSGAERRRAELAALAGRLAELDMGQLAGTELVTAGMLGRLLRDDQATLAAGLPEVAVTASFIGTLTRLLATLPATALPRDQSAQDYLTRLANLGGYMGATVDRFRAAVADGRFPTATGVRQAIAQADDYLAMSLDDDPLLRPAPPAGVDRVAWRDEAKRILDTGFRPAVGNYRDRLAEELLGVGRDDEHVGICHVPGGADGYLAAARAHTTTDLTAEQIHQIGMDVLDELRAEFAAVGSRALGTSDVPAILKRLPEDPALRFSTSAEIVACVTDALRRAEAALPDWFRPYDIAPCTVLEMNEVEAKGSVLAYYRPPAADGSRPGTHCVNTYQPTSRARFEYEALAFHESTPGHHLQNGVAQTLAGLPKFRRFGYLPAHGEGWALYTERLADEMGLYTSDLSRLGMLSFDAWRACRLVVDTGMHHYGWSRSRAIAFMRANTALSDSNIANEVDRYIAWPGQALAYMIGRIRIGELRERATTALGARFDLKTFHHHVLGNGGIPLDTLEDIVDRWIADPDAS